MGFGCVTQQGVGGYTEYQASSGMAAATVAMTDSVAAVAVVTDNGSQLDALTFDSFLRQMGKMGYPSAVVQSVLTLAWPFIPEKYRKNLQRREKKTDPTPTTPPVSAPVHSSSAFPVSSGIPWGKIGIGAGVAALAVTLYKKLIGRRR